MRQIKQYEARRNPELNPKISAYDALKPYSDDSSYYISFTQIDKIGIHPGSIFDTPLGIYTYPLDAIWKEYNIDKKRSIGRAVPFAGKRPYIWLLKVNSPEKLLNLNDYSKRDFERDKELLFKDYLKNKREYSEYKGFESDLTEEEFYRLLDHLSTFAYRRGDPSSEIWYITRELTYKYRQGYNIVRWNYILHRVLGYDGAVDRKGVGYIHENEPIQAVFFSKRAFTVVKEVLNKDYDGAMIPDWVRSATIKDGDYYMDSHIFTFSHGTWENGTWENGIWKGGYWKDGTWKDGIWKNGTWGHGVWKNGVWKNGDWEYGTWEKGTWEDGVWEDGFWEDGYWKAGLWKAGEWKDGEWKDGEWKDGTWRNGVWEDGVWEDGVWEDGYWKDGIWEEGTWKNGVWKSGSIYDEEIRSYVESDVSPKEYFENKKKL